MKMVIDGNKISRQAWGIMPKITEVDSLLHSREELRSKVIEIHPEVSFCFMNNQVPLLHGKKSAEGRLNRKTIIDCHFGPGTFEYLKDSLAGCRGWRDDDLLDACAALWTAERIQHGIDQSIPAQWPKDETGIPMRIVY
jgi:predicted RNase H-like nuclease